MKGRKPFPTALHKLRGTYRPRNHDGRAVEPSPPIMPEPPDWMNDRQQAGWRYAVENAPPNVLKRIDRATLAAWVMAEDEHREASQMQEQLNKSSEWPLLVRGREGNLMVSPYMRVVHNSALRMIKLGAEMGFTPSSRARVSSGPAPGDEAGEDANSPWAKLRLVSGGEG